LIIKTPEEYIRIHLKELGILVPLPTSVWNSLEQPNFAHQKKNPKNKTNLKFFT
jgi:hypothetical protein